ncbi:MAG TPA: alkaline phosphatase family protein [Gemmatimonadaceae bacterium]|nr:alkaline phosphatase family protein [Gemmatimonadaceae bacterium]
MPRLLALLLLATVSAPALQAQEAPRDRPALVVFVTVDQLRPDYLQRWSGQFTGGFARLLRDGVFFTNAVHDHAITETAPGHSTTMSGRFPYSTGIASNSAGVNTPTAPLVGSPGTGASPFRFEGTTLVDWMTSSDARTRVLSVSRKDRGAILPVGRGRHQVYWYAPATGRFVTSTWYADFLPGWVRSFNGEERVMNEYAGQSWNLLLPDSAYPEADSVPAESGGEDFLFPHMVSPDSARAPGQVVSTPWMDEMTFDFAWRGVRAMDLGGGPQTDVLAVSLSTTDAVGHRYGPDSRELHDQVLRLDRALGAFLDSLIALRGEENIVLGLTADHGVAPLPGVRSTWNDNSSARRLPDNAFAKAYAAVAAEVTKRGLDATAFSMDGEVLEVDREKVSGKEADVTAIARLFAREVSRVPGVQRADAIVDLASADTVRDDIARRWLHMFRPGGEVIATVTLKPFHYTGNYAGASHGTPHDYDARVPVIFWGAPFTSGRNDTRVRVVDMAPTLAEVLDVEPLERVDGRVLKQALAVRTP